MAHCVFVDYRKLNGVTRKDAYPLPRVDDALDTLSGCQWFTTLDLISGYWQVQLNSDDREKSAFTTFEGLFEFNVMPFGLCNAPATFQRLMDSVLAGLQWTSYVDDIIIPGKTFDDHLHNLNSVLRLREANLTTASKMHLECQLSWPHHLSQGYCSRPHQSRQSSNLAYSYLSLQRSAVSGTVQLLPTVHQELCRHCKATTSIDGENSHFHVERELPVCI